MSLEGRMIKKIVIFFFTEKNEERMCENPGSCLAHWKNVGKILRKEYFFKKKEENNL